MKEGLLQRFFKKIKDTLVGNIDKQEIPNKKDIKELIQGNKKNFYISSDFLGRFYKRYLRSNDDLKNKISDYESMYRDPILSMALEFIVDDTTQYSNITKKRIWVISNINELVSICNNLFSKISLQEKIWYICANTALYGNCFFRIYYKNDDFTGGIEYIEIEKDIFRYIPIEIDGVIVKFIDRYSNKLLEPFEVLVCKINMLNDYKVINNFYDIDISVMSSMNNPKMKKKNSFEYGVSFFENCRRIWKQRLLVEDNILLTRLENSAKIRLYKVNIEGLSEEAGNDLVEHYTDILSYGSKVIDQAENLIRGSDTQVTFGAKIVLPVTGNEGLTVEEFGGDNEISAIADLERLDKIFYSSLRILPEFLGLGESSGISIGETSIIRKELRYARTCKKLQFSVMNAIKMLCYYNFLSLNLDVSYEDDFDVVMNVVSTAEEEELKKALQNSVDTSKVFIEIMNEIKNLVVGEEIKFNDEDVVSIIYYILNNLLNINDIDVGKIVNNLLAEKKKKEKEEKEKEEGSNEEEGGGLGGDLGGGLGGDLGGGLGSETEGSEGGGETEGSEGGGETEGLTEGRILNKVYENKKFFIEKRQFVESCKNIIINKLTKKLYNIYNFEFDNNIRYIRECFLKDSNRSKKIFFESVNNNKLILDKKNLENIKNNYNKFDLNIFKNINIVDKDLYINDYEIDNSKEERRKKIDLKDLNFCDFLINVNDILNIEDGDVVVYRNKNKLYLNYINICRYIKNIIEENDFEFIIIELKDK